MHSHLALRLLPRLRSVSVMHGEDEHGSMWGRTKIPTIPPKPFWAFWPQPTQVWPLGKPSIHPSWHLYLHWATTCQALKRREPTVHLQRKSKKPNPKNFYVPGQLPQPHRRRIPKTTHPRYIPPANLVHNPTRNIPTFCKNVVCNPTIFINRTVVGINPEAEHTTRKRCPSPFRPCKLVQTSRTRKLSTHGGFAKPPAIFLNSYLAPKTTSGIAAKRKQKTKHSATTSVKNQQVHKILQKSKKIRAKCHQKKATVLQNSNTEARKARPQSTWTSSKHS